MATSRSFSAHGAVLFAAVLLAAATVGDTFTNDLAYLKRKWRTDVTDAGTGLDTGGVLAGWQKIVAARGEEPWEVTKAKIFAFGCDRTAIGVSMAVLLLGVWIGMVVVSEIAERRKVVPNV